MAAASVTLEALPAAYGDCLLVTCALPDREWRLLIDTGPDECWPTLKARLAMLPADGTGKRRIDLAVISHIDHDHIGAARALFSDESLQLSFGDIWFNAPASSTTRGVAEGQSLASLLGGTRAGLPWNKAWSGGAAVTASDVPFVGLPSKAGMPRITLLSPTPKSLARLFKVWDRELKRLGQSEVQRKRPEIPREVGAMDLDALAKRATPTDRAVANGSSIAFLLEYRGASLLLAADAHPTVLLPALKALAAHRGNPLPLKVDVFKLSHHGSSANTTVCERRSESAVI